MDVKTNIGKRFLKLIDKHFPKTSIFLRHTNTTKQFLGLTRPFNGTISVKIKLQTRIWRKYTRESMCQREKMDGTSTFLQ